MPWPPWFWFPNSAKELWGRHQKPLHLTGNPNLKIQPLPSWEETDLEKLTAAFQCLRRAYKTRRATFYTDKNLQDKGEGVKLQEERFRIYVWKKCINTTPKILCRKKSLHLSHDQQQTWCYRHTAPKALPQLCCFPLLLYKSMSHYRLGFCRNTKLLQGTVTPAKIILE